MIALQSTWAARVGAYPWVRSLLRAALAGAGVVAVAAGGSALLEAQRENALWFLRILLGAATAALVWALCARYRRQWTEPVQRLHRMIEQVRAGEAPPDDLIAVAGNLWPVAEQVQAMLHDFHRQRLEIAKLNQEMRQRIASRTSALERMVGSLRTQATHDELTGLHNRRMLEQALPELIERSAVEGFELALLMAEVEPFDSVADLLGHTATDDLLRALGQIIRSTVREGDWAFCLGGNEFIILLRACADVRGVVTRLQSLAQQLFTASKLPEHARLCIGHASIDELAMRDSEHLLLRAEERLQAHRG